MRTTAVLVLPLLVLVGIGRPAALIALLVLAVFVGALTRTGLWLLGDVVTGDPDVHAVRAGLVTLAAGTAFAVSAQVLGPLTVALVVPAALLVALWFRPGRPSSIRPSSILSTPLVDRPADER